MFLLNRSIIWKWFRSFVNFSRSSPWWMSLQYNLLAIPIVQKKVSPSLGSKSVLRWTLLLGVPPGGKMAGEPCQRSEVDVMILMFRKMHYKRLQMYVYTFPSTEVLNVKFESGIPRYFLFELPCGMFSDTRTGWIIRINKLQADWTLWYPIPTGVCQAYFRCDPFGVWLV